MRNVFFISLFFISLLAKAQKDSTLIIIPYTSYPQKTFALYYITLPDSLKNGQYKRYNLWQTLTAEGKYIQGKKTGTWSYYDDNEKLVKKLDHSSGKIIYLDPKNNSPEFFGDFWDQEEFISGKVKQVFTAEELKQMKGRVYYFRIKFNLSGKPIEVEPTMRSGVSLNLFTSSEERLIKVLKEMPEWTISPAVNLNAYFILPIKF